MTTRYAINEELARLRKAIQRDELNFVEHVLGIAGERVPKNEGNRAGNHFDPRRTVDPGHERTNGRRLLGGDRRPNHGGLPRGYDLDLFTAIMAVWSRGDAATTAHFRRLAIQAPAAHRPGCADPLVPAASGRARPPLWGVDQFLRHDLRPGREGVPNQEQVPALQQHGSRRDPEGEFRRGMIRLSEEFFALLQLRYWKLTDAERYWRLPTTYTRQLFQYLDKHRYRGRELSFGLYHLAKRSAPPTRPCGCTSPRSSGTSWRRTSRLWSPTATSRGSVSAEWAGRRAGEGPRSRSISPTGARSPRPTRGSPSTRWRRSTRSSPSFRTGNRGFYEQRALELGAETLLELHEESTAYCTAHPGTNPTKHFAYMIEHRRSGEGRRKV